MRTNEVINEEQVISSDNILKVTALLYVQEALQTQQFETCKELIETAKSYGAQQSDIDEVIGSYLKAKKGAKKSYKEK